MSGRPAGPSIARLGTFIVILAAVATGNVAQRASAGHDSAQPGTDQGPITITTTNPHNSHARYRARSGRSGDVVEISTDDGSHWLNVLAPVPPRPNAGAYAALGQWSSCVPASYQRVDALAVDGAGPGMLYIGTAGAVGDYLDRGCSSAQGGLYASANGAAAASMGTRGLPYAQDPAGRTTPAFDVDAVTADPRINAIYVHASGGTGPGSPPAGLYRSTDGGEAWTEVDAGLRPSSWITSSAGTTVPVFDAGGLVVDSSDPSHLIFRNDTGTYQSINAGAFWKSPGGSEAWTPSPTPVAPPVPTAVVAAAMLPQSRAAASFSPLPTGWAWQQVAPSGTVPPARQDAATAWDSADNMLLVFGGATTSSQPLGDLWSYSPSTNTWLQRASGPSARFGAAAVWDTVDNQLLVFGGQTGSNASTAYMGDLWAYRPSTNTWSALSATGAAGAPPARSHAVAAFDGSHLLMFSGEISENPMQGTNDLWSFTLSGGGSSGTWAQLQANNSSCTVTCPQQRYSASGAWNANLGALVAFGGKNGAQTVLSDLWTYGPGSGWQAGSSLSNSQEPAGRAEAGMAYDAAHAAIMVGPGLSLASGDIVDVSAAYADPSGWLRLPVATAPQPLQRRLTNFTWNPADGSFYLFGGRVAGVGADNDLWRLAPAAPVATPTAQPASTTVAGLDEGWAVDNSGNVIVTPAQIAVTGNAGARYVRVNFRIGSATDWTDAARLAAYDTVIANYQAAGIQVLGLITSEATHSSQSDWVANSREVSGGNGDNSFISSTYVQGAVKPLLAHFADRVKLWELWNEPNEYQSCSGAVCTGGSFIYPSNFAALLVDSYVAVKDPAPNGLGLAGVTLISGGLFGHSIGGVLTATNAGATYLSNVFTMGISTVGTWTAFAAAHGGRYPLDAIGQHLYVDQNLITTTTDIASYYGWIRSAVTPFETPQPTYLTEAAWSTTSVPQNVQAGNLDLLFGATRAVGYAPLLTWFELQDVPQNGLYFGLADANLTTKPSYSHYQAQVAMASAGATSTGTATSTPTASATGTETGTWTVTASATPTITATATATPSSTSTPTASGTPTATPSVTASITPTGTASLTPTGTPSASPSAIPSMTRTSTPTPTRLASPTSSATAVAVRVTIAGAWVSPGRVARGGTEVLSATIQTNVQLSGVLVDLEVYSPSNSKIYQWFTSGQSFAAGSPRTYSTSWRVPAGQSSGTYTFKIGVYGPAWSPMYIWNNSAARFTVA